jgi:3'(2'), 5'-bisphosphate nucleotidase
MSPPLLPLSTWLDQLVPIMQAAGAVVMRVYRSDFDVTTKTDDSPVTQADQMAEDLITRALTELTPEIPVVGEEAASAGLLAGETPPRFWLVDPLDGTREFVQRNGEFTVNIALIDRGRPVLGLVFLPAQGRLYGGAEGLGSWVPTGHSVPPRACRGHDGGSQPVARR